VLAWRPRQVRDAIFIEPSRGEGGCDKRGVTAQGKGMGSGNCVLPEYAKAYRSTSF